MPKTNDVTGATYEGHEGIVEHAGGRGSTRLGGLSEVDPSRELNGSVVEGFESDEREIEEREGGAPAEPQLLPAEPDRESKPLEETEEEPARDASERRQRSETPATEKEVPSSRGSSSAASRNTSEKTQPKTSGK
jgi:hypothetical protein